MRRHDDVANRLRRNGRRKGLSDRIVTRTGGRPGARSRRMMWSDGREPIDRANLGDELGGERGAHPGQAADQLTVSVRGEQAVEALVDSPDPFPCG